MKSVNGNGGFAGEEKRQRDVSGSGAAMEGDGDDDEYRELFAKFRKEFAEHIIGDAPTVSHNGPLVQLGGGGMASLAGPLFPTVASVATANAANPLPTVSVTSPAGVATTATRHAKSTV